MLTWREVPSYEVEIKRREQCASQVRQLTGLEEIFLSTCQNVIDIDIVSFLLSIGQKRREGVCKQNICTTITAGVIMEEALLSELSSLSWYICKYICSMLYITLSDNGRGEHHESRFHCQGNPTNPPGGQLA